jgi:tRNA uridine 5-carboxymethylaminomethyl modification enzyme
MLTARAEYRLRLRANNATTRLTPLALAAGCVGPERRAWFERRGEDRARSKRRWPRKPRPAKWPARAWPCAPMVRGAA